MLNLHPDQLFQTRSGITPHVLWGVPFSAMFFGEKMSAWESSARNLIYALFQTIVQENALENPKTRKKNRENSLETRENEGKNSFHKALSSENIFQLLNQAEAPNALPVGAFPILATARGLVNLVQDEILTKTEFARLLAEFESIAIDASALSLDDEPLGRLLLGGELAQTVAYQICLVRLLLPNLFSEAEWEKWRRRPEALTRQAQKILSESLNDLLDGAGSPKAALLPIFRMLAASWTRMRWLDWGFTEQNSTEKQTSKGKKTSTEDENEQKPLSNESLSETFNQTPNKSLDAPLDQTFKAPFSAPPQSATPIPPSIWDSSSLSNFEWMVRMLIYLTRPDGSLVFSCRQEKTAFWCPELFIAALKFDADLDDKRLAVSVLPDLIAQNADKHRKNLPDCSNHSPWGRIRIMQKSWKSRTGSIITWDANYPRLEILNRKTPLLSGEWSFEGSWRGKPLSPRGDWKILFNHSAEEAEYLELEMELTEGFSLQRHVLLAKKDRFLLLGEAVSGDHFHGESIQEGKLRWRSSLPCSPGATLRQNGLSTELYAAVLNRCAASLLPLALPEWQNMLKDGYGFSLEKHCLQYDFQTDISAFYFPIFIDLDPQRTRSALTWRQLSVGERLQNLPPHRAVGFRIQIDDEQWLVYRSLTDSVNRSVLGKNLNSETYVGKFTPEGRYEPILEIIATDDA